MQNFESAVFLLNFCIAILLAFFPNSILNLVLFESISIELIKDLKSQGSTAIPEFFDILKISLYIIAVLIKVLPEARVVISF